jgi:hypothetical protein
VGQKLEQCRMNEVNEEHTRLIARGFFVCRYVVSMQLFTRHKRPEELPPLHSGYAGHALSIAHPKRELVHGVYAFLQVLFFMLFCAALTFIAQFQDNSIILMLFTNYEGF